MRWIFATYDKVRTASRQLFVDLGYVPKERDFITADWVDGRFRQTFKDKERNKAIDVFFDKLEESRDRVFRPAVKDGAVETAS